jgi:mRNA interferase MazF
LSTPRTTHAPKRGDIYLVNFDPTIGAEMQKTRPAIVIQNDYSNHSSPVTIVAAISSQFSIPLHPTEVHLDHGEGGLNKDSVVLCNQIRTVDRKRLIRRMGNLQTSRMRLVDTALSISLGLSTLQ